MYLHGTARVNSLGHLEIGGCDCTQLAEQYGTPLYVYDEWLIREKCRRYVRACKKSAIPFKIAYASKALSIKAICQIVQEEGLHIDVVSGGELYTALSVGFPPSRIHFHGSNKSEEEIEFALTADIGCFVVDNFYELTMLDRLAKKHQKIVPILLRIAPGVESGTHEYISTGRQDSKFGFDVATNQAYEAVNTALKLSSLHLLGLHSHIGSQIFDKKRFESVIVIMAKFLDTIRLSLSFTAEVLNVGGGLGIRYHQEDTPLSEEEYIQAIMDTVKESFQTINYPVPEIWIEPGRSIVGEAGTTLYKVGAIKEVPGICKYVSVDGGMTDNLRPALYQAKYEAMIVNKALCPDEETVTIAGKCCESGDILIKDVCVPKVQSGDLLAMFCTGAYGYSMASNYNRILRPPIIFVKDEKSTLVVERETYQDLLIREHGIYINNVY
ncbi:diaminopimelate decarboxylase [Aneurinibacillus sp. REN35]|uniref:diaminopimelate decarboxylase n=1 Tax=Aneurinibacillus sp. REN35 TaxID=3237286 RepID=UPI003527F4AB